MQDSTERERKYDVPDAFALPDPATLAPEGGRVEGDVVRLHSTYFDTADHRLIRSGITLRRRTGDADTGWHLKVPAGDARTELHLPDGGDSVPEQFVSLVRGLTNGEPLGVIATLDTERHRHRILDAGGSALAEVADDTVTAAVVGDGAGVSRWREVEVELGEGDESLLDRSAEWLATAGAEPARSGSKLARAIGRDLRPSLAEGSLEALVHRYLSEQQAAMVAGDIGLRRGGDVVHPTRVATRRFRSVLRVCADLFDEPRAVALDAELQWYAQALGRVRDVQVLRKHLGGALDAMADRSLAQRTSLLLDEQFAMDEGIARDALDAVLDSHRYAALLDEVRGWVEEIPLPTGRPETAVRRYLRAAERTTNRRLRKASRHGAADDVMHRARKAAKRARNVAELATPALGKRAARTVKDGKRLQDSFGELQDAVVAGEFLRRAARNADADVAFALGLMWRDEQDRARRARRAARKRAKKTLSS